MSCTSVIDVALFSGMMILKAFVFCLVINYSASVDIDPARSVVEKESGGSYSSRTFRNALNQQSFQTILQSIEDRLRNLDQVYSMRCTSTASDQYLRKIEQLELKITRLETILDAQMNKLSENMNSKSFKDDMYRDQIIRKIDSVYDRLNHKITYVEGKVDMDLFKTMNKIDSSVTKIDRLHHSVSVRQADMETTISEGMNRVERMKNEINRIENSIMNTTKNNIENYYQQQIEIMENNFDNVTKQLQEITDGSKNQTQTIVKQLQGNEAKITNLGTKITNMYNELWKKSEKIEENANMTRNEIQTTLSNLVEKFETGKHQNDKQNEDNYEAISNIFQKKLSELSRKFDKQFDVVILKQQMFIDGCKRVQVQEQQLEVKLSEVLGKFYDSFINKTDKLLSNVNYIDNLVNLHHDQIYNEIIQISSLLLRLANKTTEDRKRVEKTMANVKEDLGKYLVSVKQNMNLNSNEHIKKLQYIVDLILEIRASNDREKLNGDNIKFIKQEINTRIGNETNLINNLIEKLHSIASEIKYEKIHTNEPAGKTKSLEDDEESLENDDLEDKLGDDDIVDYKESGDVEDEQRDEEYVQDDPEIENINIKTLSGNMNKTILDRYNYTVVNDLSPKNLSNVMSDGAFVKVNESAYNMTGYFDASFSEVYFFNEEKHDDKIKTENSDDFASQEFLDYETEADE